MNILGNKYKIHFVSKMPKDILVEENKAIGVTQFDEKRIYIVYQDSTFLTNKTFWHEIGHIIAINMSGYIPAEEEIPEAFEFIPNILLEAEKVLKKFKKWKKNKI